MQESTHQKMPTGISSLDPILDGGVPPGSVILLLGDLGAGNYEYVYSSIVNILQLAKEGAPRGAGTPQEIRYITFTRLEEDVRQEITSSLHIDGLDVLLDSVHFDDLSELYFDNSVVPDEWYSHSDIMTRLQKRTSRENILLQLSKVVNGVKPGSLIVLDSITDVATQSTIPNYWTNLTGFLRGLQRVSKQRGITSYLLLSRGILDSSKEIELADIADAVLLFRWEETTGARRQRVMYFEKFRGVMSHLEERDLVKFAVRISTTGGFEVSNIRVVI
ncbi:MAG: ATPase domain-containing protein [Methanoregula sp.]|jgi:KaiC/GvpD/RAD55 family RecA-like ATPase|uniref:RAD55 family ATPase n=1 Tax=Methanoregula sp. TaxID=2052170 RepID=UPI003D0D2889